MADLYTLDECPELYVDAFACDEQRNLVFLSAWGRDTAMHEFLARLSLGASEGGLQQFHIQTSQRSLPTYPVVEMLEKRTTRLYRGTLFGSLLHLWLFDKRCLNPDMANHFAYALLRPGENPQERLWPLVTTTCPLPLLEHWRLPVMKLLTDRRMLAPLPGHLGKVEIWQLRIDLPVLQEELGQMIQCGILNPT